MRFTLLPLLACAGLAGGCASIVGGTSQHVRVEARKDAKPVTGAQCRLANSKGTYQVTSPGTVTISRAFDDLTVRCELDPLEPGTASVRSSTKALAFGNILFGGLIGVAIDATSGAAYDYPEDIQVDMGSNTLVTMASAAETALERDLATPTAGQTATLAVAARPATPAVPAPGVSGRAPREEQPMTMDSLSGLLAPR